MSRRFDSFVIFAEMRTGSNFLESNLDLFPGLETHGEAFNPYFIVRPDMPELFGIDVKTRNENPVALFDRMKERSIGIPGFRFFHDHDRRIFERVIDDPACAKVVLTRNFVDAYVSRAIARETNQWALGNVTHAKKAKVHFDADEFAVQLGEIKAFQLEVLGRLQRSGQTAFYISYDDIRELDVINGLGRFLGEETRLEALSSKFKKQNPEPIRDKVENVAELEAAVAGITAFDLDDAPNFEPRRAANVPSFVTAAEAPLMYLPVRGGPVNEVRGWLAALDGVAEEALVTEMRQKDLRKWKRLNPGHRSFTVLSHPALRAHRAFCTHFACGGPETFLETRQALVEHYGLVLPEGVPGPDWSVEAHRAGFLGWLDFLRLNLAGQTPIRVDRAWASMAQIVDGFAQVVHPDLMIREHQLAEGLSRLCAEIGRDMPEVPEVAAEAPYTLDEIYDKGVEKAVHAAYQRDYMMFGFGPWRDRGRG